jgi:uncharacterized protein (UPF0303 family)
MLYRHRSPHQPSDMDLAAQALHDEAAHRFPSFDTNDAVTLGLSLRKRFRASSRHQKQGRAMALAVQTPGGAPLFACAVGDGVSAEDWAALDGALAVVRRTAHSSFYVEKGAGARGERERREVRGETRICGGGAWALSCCGCGVANVCAAFPIFLEVCTRRRRRPG